MLDYHVFSARRARYAEALVELLREAVDELAIAYEDTAFATLGQTTKEQDASGTVPYRRARRGYARPVYTNAHLDY